MKIHEIISANDKLDKVMMETVANEIKPWQGKIKKIRTTKVIHVL